ncbi:MAG: PAS domain-containing sensor histidine kinase [Flavisolibacter sp.]
MVKESLQIDKESYRRLIESVKDYAIFMIDRKGYVISWNKSAEQIEGYTEDEILGRPVSIFYTAEDITNGEPESDLKKVVELKQFEKEGWRVRKDGSVFWANIVFSTITDHNGELLGFSNAVRDMTRRLKADEEIDRLNKELRTQLQKSRSEISDYKHALDESCIVAITNQKGIITHVNRNFCKISKYSEEELIGEDHRIINSGFHPKEFIRDIWVTITNGRIWRGELKNKAKDGSYYWVDTTIVPFLNEEGKPFQYLAIRSDITQRKLAEENIININEGLEKKIKERTLELTEALEQAKELNEMKSRFITLASHEFRTPLSAILSSISLIDHYLTPEHEEKRNKHVERIKASVRNLTGILDNFLSLERLEQGNLETRCTGFELCEFINDAIDEIDGMVKKKNQKINFDYGNSIEIHQDKKILRNVLLNLLSNAVKYSHEGKEIYIDLDVKDPIISISIRDEGIGIPQEAQKDMFSKFFRAGNVSNIQGTGLGLNIVKKYVELLDGNIYFISKENEGSTFTVQFPQFKDENADS